MKVVELAAYGEPLQLVERAVREPGRGQVRVRVDAATVNPVDWLVAGGVLAGMTSHLPLPLVLGWDVVGRVEAVGPDVDVVVGQPVAAMIPWFSTGAGAFAETVLVDQAWVAALPEGLDPVVAATVPLNGQTAAQAVELLGPLDGRRVLVTGASGGVGGFAVQLAAAAGAEVVATVSAGDEDRVRGLGARQTVGRRDDLVDAVRQLVPDGVDAVLDTVPVGPPLVAAVRDGGVFVTVLDYAMPEPERGVRVAKVSVTPDRDQLASLLADLAAGRLSTRVAQQLPLADAELALKTASAGGLAGKVVLVP